MGLSLGRAAAVLVNDAVVVLCFTGLGQAHALTVHWVQRRVGELGVPMTKATASSALHRAMGRVKYSGPPTYEWELTAAGHEYRLHVLETLERVLLKSR